MDRAAAVPTPCVRPDAVARPDEAEFDAFYRRTERALRAYVFRVTGHAADADDIVQEAFLRLLRAGPESGDEAWRRYLYRVASHLVVDRWRARRRWRDDEHTASSPESTTPGPDGDVARTFAELPSRERALLWLAYVEGETHEEMAASLGVGRRSVKVLLFRARRRLRDLLQAKGIGGSNR